jgi:hypothetical protein
VRRRMLGAKIHRVISNFSHGYFLPDSPYTSSRVTRGTISRGSMVTGW